MSGEASSARRPRIAFVSFSTGEFDSRTERMARSALDAGYDVVAYARWQPGLPLTADRDGYRIVRVPVDTWLAVPFLASRGRRRIAAQLAAANAGVAAASPSSSKPTVTDPRATGALSAKPPARGLTGRVRRAVEGTPLFRPLRAVRDLARLPRRWLLFPASLRAFAIALDDVAEPADLWHGMSIQGLPAVVRRKKHSNGRAKALYDSRDVYMHARELARVGGARRWLFETAERRWAHGCDAVLTVNDEYARILEGQLRVPRPPVVMNCPPRWTPPEPRPNLIRSALALPQETSIALYQGGLFSERGIEEAMDAILAVPEAALVLLGYGRLRDSLAAAVEREPYRGRVFLLPAVPPSELLLWTASADIMVMAIQPTSLNHRHTTPNKLFEAMTAGVPVVASDLPGMATIVRETGCGVLVDPTSPAAIAGALRRLLELPAAERAALRDRCLAAARDRFNWESQVGTLLEVYGRLVGPGAPSGR